MCYHDNVQTIEEGVTEEVWEGDFYVQNTFDWVYCPECDDDYACKVK